MVTTNLRCSLELLNLITGHRIPLTLFQTIPGINMVAVRSRYPCVCFDQPDAELQQQPDWMPDVMLRKVALSRTPEHPDSCMVVALFSSCFPLQMIAVVVHPLVEWIRLKVPLDIGVSKYDDICVHDVDNHGDLWS